MLTPTAFNWLVDELARRGYSEAVAVDYAVRIGDTPEIDGAGQLLMTRVIAAADRGVKVRILFDDLSTMLHDMTHVEMRDSLLYRIDRHPND